MPTSQPQVKAFFDAATNTVSYVVWQSSHEACCVIDPVLDYDAAAGRTNTGSADALIRWVRERQLTVHFVLDTHIHADHLSALHYIKQELGGATCIGRQVPAAQQLFGQLFNASPFATDGSQFDRLLGEGDAIEFGDLRLKALHTPGHTPACMSYLVGDAVFVGDTLFMPDYGTARCDFPGGDAGQLYDSIHKLFALPGSTRMFLCHDYLPDSRSEYCWETTVAKQRANNVHVHAGVSRAQFVEYRSQRDATLDAPALILPSIQVNMRAGAMPPPDANGISYLKIPINAFGSKDN